MTLRSSTGSFCQLLAPRSLCVAGVLAVLLAAPARAGGTFDPLTAEAPATAGDLAAKIESFAATALERLGAPPGLGLAVVRDGEALYVGGVGYRDTVAKLPVTADTAFYIASSTKSFTALAVALLADRGELDLDLPVADYLPEAELPGEEPVTLRQLLSHTSGLENQPVVLRTAYTGEHDPETLVALLASSEAGDRAFDYTNFGYVVASLILDRVTEGGWRELLDREIFEPLGMERTTGYVSRAAGWPMATPHMESADGFRPMAMLKTDATMHAAGGTLSTPRDLARWLEAQLSGGRVDGVEVFPERVIAETHRRQATADQRFFLFQRTGYGLGWYLADYEGESMLHHFGGFEGWRAHVSFLPEHGIGVAALINSSGHGFFVPDLVAAYAYDLLRGKPDLEAKYEARLAELEEQIGKRKERMAAGLAERAGREWTLTRPRADYAGVYANELLGRAELAAGDGELTLRVGQLSAVLEPFTEPETARVELPPGSGGLIRFDVAEEGAVRGFTFRGYYFERSGGASIGEGERPAAEAVHGGRR